MTPVALPSPSSGAALVTGGARRIGRAISLQLAAGGYAVAIHARSSKGEAAELANEIAASGGRAAVVTGDLSDPEAVDRLVPAAAAQIGPLTCLVNNASEFNDDVLGSMTREAYRRHAIVNLETPVFLAQAFAAQLPASSNGNVINVIDQRVWNLTPEYFSYSLSKAGLHSANRMLAMALAPAIRVNAVAPGPVLQSIHQSAADFAAECAGTPLRHGASPDEIAAAVRFILATASMTGQMIALDGGQHLG